MSQSVVFYILSFFLLLAICQPASTYPSQGTNSASSEESNEEKEIAKRSAENEENPRTDLLLFTLNEFAVLAKYTVIEGQNIVQKVLKEIKDPQVKTSDLEEHIANFTSFVQRAEKFRDEQNDDSIPELFDLMVVFSDIAESYNATAQENGSKDAVLTASFKRNGIDELEEDFSQRFLKFSEKFEKQLDKYFSSLTESEKQKESKMKDWYKSFEDETDIEKKVEIFARFFDFYE